MTESPSVGFVDPFVNKHDVGDTISSMLEKSGISVAFMISNLEEAQNFIEKPPHTIVLDPYATITREQTFEEREALRGLLELRKLFPHAHIMTWSMLDFVKGDSHVDKNAGFDTISQAILATFD